MGWKVRGVYQLQNLPLGWRSQKIIGDCQEIAPSFGDAWEGQSLGFYAHPGDY
jgi:hypothetical protein